MTGAVQLFLLLLQASKYSDSLPPYMVPVDPPRYTVKYFQQDVDHFNYADHGRWSEKYLLADEYWTGKGPLFFYSGNEDAIEHFYNKCTFVFTLAKTFKALVVFAEHRYYGASLPFGKESFDPVAMGFLSVEQALADYAVLIGSLRQDYSGITKVITFGGSYGGMLSAWMRFKYPNVVDGALAASAPIYYVDDLVPKTAFYEKVTEDFASVNERFPQYVREGFSMMLELAKAGPAGLTKLTEEFHLCDPLTVDTVEHLIEQIKNWLAVLTMYDNSNAVSSPDGSLVEGYCTMLLSEDNRLRGLAKGARIFYNTAGDGEGCRCFNITPCAESLFCSTEPKMLSWEYQICTEIVSPSAANNVTDMFPPKVDNNTDHCLKQWGVQPRPGWMTTQLWGKDISSATNIIFSNGDRDPWSTGGVTKDLSDSLIAIVVKGAAHHLDLKAPTSMDSQSLVQARKREMEIIKQWIS